MTQHREFSGTVGGVFTALSLFMISLAWFATSEFIGMFAKVLPILAGLGYLLYRRSRPSNRELFPLRRTIWLLTLFALYQALSLPMTPLPELGMQSVLNGFYVLVVFVLLLLLLEGGFRQEWLETGLLSVAGVFAIANIPNLVQWWLGWARIQGSVFSIPPTSFRLPGAFLSHPNIEAAFINLAIPLALYRAMTTSRKSRKLGLGFLLFLFAGIEFFASSRGAWIALLFSVTLLLSLIWYIKAGSFAAMTQGVLGANSLALLHTLTAPVECRWLCSVRHASVASTTPHPCTCRALACRDLEYRTRCIPKLTDPWKRARIISLSLRSWRRNTARFLPCTCPQPGSSDRRRTRHNRAGYHGGFRTCWALGVDISVAIWRVSDQATVGCIRWSALNGRSAWHGRLPFRGASFYDFSSFDIGVN